ncbi:MAG: LPS export ABC transporter ATP-binding protein [Deltaproteobacteria bacterium]|nr:LPS export ABC transporter ATP-binding protein [Deltaproteobacteria bacterium]MBW2218710.1 LPS export ABC transporter ATP-binding protein [Deltaproteobacteria bacterium]
MATLFLENLIKKYHGRKVVDQVELKVETGCVVGLLGPNGAGKTTTFFMAVGMIKVDGGRVLLDDEDITELPMHLRSRKGIGYLPQEVSIFKKLSVSDNIMVVLEILNVPGTERRKRAETLLDELGIRHLSGQKAGVLSGGERRRLEITRVLATKPSFILLDEPFAGIDPLAIIDIQKIIKHLTGRGIGVLISDHNVRETLGVCDLAYILNNGKVIASGTAEDIASSKTARQIYLGEEFTL